MRGCYQGKWYAEVYESTRHVGIETLSVHQFDTQRDRDDFIIEYNQILFTHGNKTPRVYTMATEPSIYVIHDFLRGKYK